MTDSIKPKRKLKRQSQDEDAALCAFERAHEEFTHGHFLEAQAQFRALMKEYAGVPEVTAYACTYLAIIESRANADENITSKVHEANLESIIIEQLEIIEKGLRLVKRQYVCPGVGRIDLLCKDKKGNFVVIELKKFGVKHDSILDQILRYMGYVKVHLVKGDQKVRGIIVVGKVDEKLRYAVSAAPDITVKTFNLTIE